MTGAGENHEDDGTGTALAVPVLFQEQARRAIPHPVRNSEYIPIFSSATCAFTVEWKQNLPGVRKRDPANDQLRHVWG